jgi:hypothetical protein
MANTTIIPLHKRGFFCVLHITLLKAYSSDADIENTKNPLDKTYVSNT